MSTWPTLPMPGSAPSAPVADEAAWAVSLAALAVLANNAPAVAATDASNAASGKADWVCVSRPSEDAPIGAASRLMGAPVCANDNDAGVFASDAAPAWDCPGTLPYASLASFADDAGWVAPPLGRVGLTAVADALVAAAAAVVTNADVSPFSKWEVADAWAREASTFCTASDVDAVPVAWDAPLLAPEASVVLAWSASCALPLAAACAGNVVAAPRVEAIAAGSPMRLAESKDLACATSKVCRALSAVVGGMAFSCARDDVLDTSVVACELACEAPEG